MPPSNRPANPLARLWAAIASRRLSAWLIVIITLGYLVWVLPFQFYGVPAWRTRNIAEAWGFKWLGIALLVNSIACLINQVPRAFRRARREWGPARSALGRAEAVHASSPLPKADAIDSAARLLRRSRFRVSVSDDGFVRAAKGRWSPFGTLLSHISIILLAVAVVAGSHAFMGKVLLVEGESFQGSDREAYTEPSSTVLATIPDSQMPRLSFDLLTVTPGFWRDVQLFNKLEALLSVGGKPVITRINQPVRVGDSYVAVADFGYAPEIQVTAPGGQAQSAFVRMKVFPPGAVDSVELPETPYRLEMKVYPDAEVTGDSVADRSYNLLDPAVVVRVRDVLQAGTDNYVYQGVLRLGQPARFQGYTVRIPSIRYYAQLRIVRDPGIVWFVSAILCGLLGLMVRFLSRQRVVLLEVGDATRGSDVRLLATAEQWDAAFAERVQSTLFEALRLEPAAEDRGEAE